MKIRKGDVIVVLAVLVAVGLAVVVDYHRERARNLAREIVKQGAAK